MINALFASQEGGTKNFCDASGIHFGWKAIMNMYSRECQRQEKGQTRMIPKLHEAYILRDSWTKLNVAPAKIMQLYVCVCVFGCLCVFVCLCVFACICVRVYVDMSAHVWGYI